MLLAHLLPCCHSASGYPTHLFILTWCETRVPAQSLVSLFKETKYSIEKHIVFSLLCSIEKLACRNAVVATNAPNEP